MNQQRRERIAETIRQELSDIIQKEMKDPRIGFVTIIRVTVTNDLRYADVYFSVFGKDKDKISSKIGLQNAAGYLRKEIGQRLRMRFIPEIRFKFDRSIEYSAHIDEVLEKLEREKHNIDYTD